MSNNKENAKVAPWVAPTGYEDKSQDAVGTWDYTRGPIHFVPEVARLVDSSVESTKYSILVQGLLLKPPEGCPPCPIVDRDGNEAEAEPGDMVIVWVSGGNRSLLQWASAKVFMYQDGELDTGKPNAMKVFKVFAAKGSSKKQIPLESDFRKDSKKASTPWTDAATRPGTERERSRRRRQDEELDDIPF